MKILFVLFILIQSFSYAQDDQVLNVIHDDLLVIDQDRYLIVRHGDGLRLIDSQGKLLYHYTERLMADISSLDVTTSLRPMLFFGDIPAFQILDNTLSPHTSAIDLQDMDMPDVTLMCAAVNNGYWVYDAVAFELRRMDEQMNIQVESGGLNVILGKSIAPTKILARSNRLYLSDPTTGIHVFDFYAGYLGVLVAQKGLSDFDIKNGILVFADSQGQIFQTGIIHDRVLLHTQDPSEPIFKSESAKITSVSIVGDRIYVGNGEQVLPFTLKP